MNGKAPLRLISIGSIRPRALPFRIVSNKRYSALLRSSKVS
jgi:hypothetical protein